MKILFATDFQKAAPEELSSVISIARRFEGEVYLLHVMTDLLRDWIKSGMVEMRAEERLNSWSQKLEEEGIDFKESYVMKGNAADTIVQTGEAIDADLILVGAEDKSAVLRFLQGTTAETVLRHAHSSVLINKKYAHENPASMLCAIDESDQSTKIVRTARDWAKAYDVPINILHVVQLPVGNPLGLDEDELEEKYEEFKEDRRTAIRKNFKEVDLKGIDSEFEIQWGVPHEVIKNKIEDDEYDLLIIGATGRSNLSVITLGSTATRLIRAVECPALIVK